MYVLIGADIRPHAIEALSRLMDHIKSDLVSEVEVYEQANNTHQSIKVILYFNVQESVKLNNVLKELNLQGAPNIILIDACDNKLSASNV